VAVTIRDVAQRAGVSVSTVSRSLGRPDLVRPDTREMVLRVAEQLDYRPSRTARSLTTGRTGNIGIIVPDLGNPFFPDILSGAQARARESDLSVFFADSGEDPRLEAELIRAMAKQVDGIIVCSARTAGADLRSAAEHTSLVLINRRYAGIPAVLMDSAGGSRQVIEHLAALGHGRVAYLSGPRNSWSNQQRGRGMRQAARACDVEIVEIGPFAPRFEAGQQGADLAMAADVTAIFAFNDFMALGVLQRLADREVSVPTEISVIGFDDIAMAGMCAPGLTTVSMPTQAAGRAAVGLLVERLSATTEGDANNQRRLATQLIVRASTAPPKVSGPVPDHASRVSSTQESEGS
jgi:DNA-binding LacI/PurR family transcriptional regulator